MARSYYTLAERCDGRWVVQAGGYDLETIEFERDDFRDHGVKAKDLRILKTAPSQKAINAAVAALNAKGA